MQNILGDTDVEEAIPALHWAKIRRALKPFTYISGIDREIRFIHGAFYQVYICVLLCLFVFFQSDDDDDDDDNDDDDDSTTTTMIWMVN